MEFFLIRFTKVPLINDLFSVCCKVWRSEVPPPPPRPFFFGFKQSSMKTGLVQTHTPVMMWFKPTKKIRVNPRAHALDHGHHRSCLVLQSLPPPPFHFPIYSWDVIYWWFVIRITSPNSLPGSRHFLIAHRLAAFIRPY